MLGTTHKICMQGVFLHMHSEFLLICNNLFSEIKISVDYLHYTLVIVHYIVAVNCGG